MTNDHMNGTKGSVSRRAFNKGLAAASGVGLV